jgi:hypothetical protein
MKMSKWWKRQTSARLELAKRAELTNTTNTYNMADDNNRTSDDSLLPAAVPSRRRKRRKKLSSSSAQRIITGSSSYANLNEDDNVDCWRHHNHHTTTTISNNNNSSRSNTNCDAMDAELENQVNQLMTLQRSNHQTKKKRHVTQIDDHTTNYCADKEQVDNTQKSSSNDNSNMSSALPILLHIREIGLSSSSSSQLGRRYNNNQRTMMTLLLHQPPPYDDHSNDIIARRLRVPIPNRHVLHNNDNDNGTNYQDSTSKEASILPFYKQTTSLTWRPYTQQTIPFSKLNTPHSVAILAMDQWGGYSIGMAATADGGGGSCNNRDGRRRRRGGEPSLSALLRRPSLSLNFYGIPSPARLLLSSSVGGQQSSSSSVSSSSMMISPLVHSIPLLLLNNQYNNHSLESNDEAAYSPVVQIRDTPIQILLCSNGAFGVGYILDSRTTSAAALRLDIFSKSPGLQVSSSNDASSSFVVGCVEWDNIISYALTTVTNQILCCLARSLVRMTLWER